MSRFKYIYEPLVIIKLAHQDALKTADYVKFYPNAETMEKISQYKLVVKEIPEGLVVLYKKQEEFIAETVDEVITINGEEVTDTRIVGYVSTTPDKTFSNWLPEVVDVDLEFYATAEQKYRENTKWDALALNEFIVYTEADLQGTKNEINTINERKKPDAVLQVNIQEANITTPETITFQIN